MSGLSIQTLPRSLAERIDELRELNAVVGRDHLRGFFADHDARRVGIAADNVGHDACIRHAQFAHARDPESRIDDAADPASAGQVVHGD